MTEDIRDSYIAGLDPKWAPLLLALDRAIMAVRPDFGRRVAYGLLMYTLGGDTRHWVCATGATKKGVNLRFLWGVLLSDPRGVLRAGTGVLRTIDFPTLESVDAELVREYLTEAISKMEYYKAHEKEY